MRLRHERFAVWSILSFFFPLALAWRWRIDALALVLAAVIVFSFLNHLWRSKPLRLLDELFAWVLMALQFYLCVLGHFALPEFLGVLVLVPIALVFYWRRSRGNYDLNHGLWHLFSTTISVFAQLTYLAGAAR